MKIAVVSDLHLDTVTHGVDRFEDGVAALNQAVDEACSLEFDAFVFCGDLCNPDTHRSHRAVAAMTAACHTLQGFDVRVFVIPGNHDVIEDGSGGHVLMQLHASGLAHVYSQPTFLEPDARWVRVGRPPELPLLFLPFVPSSHNYDPAQFVREHATDRRVLVFGHLNLPRAMGGSESSTMARGRDVFWPLDAIREHLPNAVCIGGHYHRHQEVDLVTIVGSPTRLRFDEEDNFPGWLKIDTELLDVGKGIEFVPTTNPRVLRTVAADDPVWSYEGVTNAAPVGFKGSDLKGAIVRLQVPVGIADGKVAEVKKLHEQFGAARVFVGGREREDKLSEPVDDLGNVPESQTPREAVFDRLERTASIEDKKSVRGLLERALES